MKCRRCNRGLKREPWVTAGIGRICLKKENIERQIELFPKGPEMQNQAMKRKLEKGECVDLSQCPLNDDGDYILSSFQEDVDYCDSKKEGWIWSIGKNKVTGEILASGSTKFYQNDQYECLFLR